jgi:hypothetical protein
LQIGIDIFADFDLEGTKSLLQPLFHFSGNRCSIQTIERCQQRQPGFLRNMQ